MKITMKDAIRKARAVFSQVKLTQEPLSDGSIIQYDTDTITVGEPIFLMDPQGDFSILPDGDYKTKTNASFTIKDGLCSAYTASMSTGDTDKADETKEQAQAAKVPVEDQGKDKVNDTASNEGKDAPADEGKTSLDDAAPADETDDDAAIDQQQIADMIAQALAPIMQSISEIRSLVDSYAAECRTTTDQMSTIKTKVEVLSKQPAGSQVEETSRFIKPSKDIMENRALKIMRPDLNR